MPKIRGGVPAPAWMMEHTDRNMHVVGPRPEVLEAWRLADLELPDLATIRRYRVERIRSELRQRNVDAMLLYDPVNIRYATDSTNMSIWTSHNAVRYALVCAEGPLVMFEFSKGEFLSAHSEVVDEIRPAVSFMPYYAGSRVYEIAAKWARGVTEIVKEHARSGGLRIAADVLPLDGVRALEAVEVDLLSGMAFMEDARMVKHPEEIKAMRCAVHACQRSIDDMRAIFEPGVTEVELWAELQRSNFLNFGEWIETRLLASGQRTNPWYHEASSKVVEAGEIMAFDTDMISAYGICVDMSRSWLCGGGQPNPAQADVYGRAVDMIDRNIPLFVAGATLRDITDKATYQSPEAFNGYTVLAHGVGLADEYPSVFIRESWDETGFDDVIEVGNVICVEAFVGRKSGGEGIKLEQQVLVTESGPEILTDYSMALS
ncbi:MAG: aminopeptidase P family protein [Acidimicrobiia bacterium]|nr:aminopeptidase P family protein [Acidimicrobiia bacterium]